MKFINVANGQSTILTTSGGAQSPSGKHYVVFGNSAPTDAEIPGTNFTIYRMDKNKPVVIAREEINGDIPESNKVTWHSDTELTIFNLRNADGSDKAKTPTKFAKIVLKNGKWVFNKLNKP